jgi:hypothetical protein
VRALLVLLQATAKKIRNKTGSATVFLSDDSIDQDALLDEFGDNDAATGLKRLAPKYLFFERMWAIADFQVRETGDEVSFCGNRSWILGHDDYPCVCVPYRVADRVLQRREAL